MIHLLILLFLSFFQYGGAQQTLYPPAIPLAVRSPTFSSWQFTPSGSSVGSLWPTTASHQPNASQDPSLNSLNTVVLVRVDAITYLFLGYANTINVTVNLTNTLITPTQTKLIADAGNMQFNLTFLNPIEPGDWIKQSMPFSYVSLTAASLDGAPHDVQCQMYLSSEWMSGDRSQIITWTTTTNSDVVFHSVSLQNPTLFEEIATQQEWGTLHIAMKSGGNTTYKLDNVTTALTQFQQTGAYDNTTATNFRAIDDNWPIFGIARDLGSITSTQDPVLWATGFVTDPAINYTNPSSGATQQRSLYYKSKYPGADDTSLIVDFLNDFANAASRAQQLDSKILQAAASVSGPLADLVSLATAQVYGSTQLTIGSDSSGNFNTSDVMAFMKNVGGSQPNRVNPVETLYSAFPAFMYIDPSFGGLLLEPLFRGQASPTYTSPYAAADLGTGYPNVTIGNAVLNQAVEQSGNMLIMTYAHARASGNGNMIGTYYNLLTTWADYLSNSTLSTNAQSSADGLSANNQTNLAIKGIIAIQAMSKMSAIVKEAADAKKYSTVATNLYNQWKSFALASDQHLLAAYGQSSSWTLAYNLFADMWLNTTVVDPSVYIGQSSYIDNLVTTLTFSSFGMPVDNLGSDTGVIVSSWNMFVAAMTPNQDLRTKLISKVHNRASFNNSAGVFPLDYDSTTGATMLGGASPAQGAVYAPLVLSVPAMQIASNITAPAPSGIGPSSKSKSHVGAIVGGTVGGVAGLFVIGILAAMWRRQSLKSAASSGGNISRRPEDTVTPFNAMAFDPVGSILTGTAPSTVGTSQTTEQQQPLMSGVHSSEGGGPVPGPSSAPPLRVVPVPTNLSAKELAQLRSATSQPSSQPSLSTAMLSPQSDTPPSTFPPGRANTNTDGSSTTTRSRVEDRPWQSEVESLRREMEQLRAERFDAEAPPSYFSEAGAV